jgi:hypothetical protein
MSAVALRRAPLRFFDESMIFDGGAMSFGFLGGM